MTAEAGPTAVRRATAPAPDRSAVRPHPGPTTALVSAHLERRRVRLLYRAEAGSRSEVDVDPWAVVVRHGRWYLLCHSHRAAARRSYRIDRVASVEALDETSTVPAALDPVTELEAHLAVGSEYDTQVVLRAPLATLERCLPGALGRLEALDHGTTRLVGSTSNPTWYATQLATVPADFTVVACRELQDAVRVLGERMPAAARR